MPNRFKIEDIRLLRVSFSQSQFQPETLHDPSRSEREIREGHADQPIEAKVEVQCRTRYDDEKNALIVIFEASIGDQNKEFMLDAAIGGTFKFEEKPDAAILGMLQSVNCPAILFPYLREFISDMTKRAGLESLYLPPMNFVHGQERKTKKKTGPSKSRK